MVSKSSRFHCSVGYFSSVIHQDTFNRSDEKNELDAKALEASLNPHKRMAKGKNMSMNQHAVFCTDNFQVHVAVRALPLFGLTPLAFLLRVRALAFKDKDLGVERKHATGKNFYAHLNYEDGSPILDEAGESWSHDSLLQL